MANLLAKQGYSRTAFLIFFLNFYLGFEHDLIGDIANSFFLQSIGLWGARRQKEFNHRVSLLVSMESNPNLASVDYQRHFFFFFSDQTPADSWVPSLGMSIFWGPDAARRVFSGYPLYVFELFCVRLLIHCLIINMQEQYTLLTEPVEWSAEEQSTVFFGDVFVCPPPMASLPTAFPWGLTERYAKMPLKRSCLFSVLTFLESCPTESLGQIPPGLWEAKYIMNIWCMSS